MPSTISKGIGSTSFFFGSIFKAIGNFVGSVFKAVASVFKTLLKIPLVRAVA